MLSLRKASNKDCKEFGGFWTHGGGGRNQTQEPEKKKTCDPPLETSKGFKEGL